MFGSNPPPSPPLLSSNEIRLLEESRILLGPQSGNKCKVSGAFISPPESERSNSSAGITATFSRRNINDATPADFDLPLDAESPEALEWIGLVPRAAKRICSGYLSRPNPVRSCLSVIYYANYFR